MAYPEYSDVSLAERPLALVATALIDQAGYWQPKNNEPVADLEEQFLIAVDGIPESVVAPPEVATQNEIKSFELHEGTVAVESVNFISKMFRKLKNSKLLTTARQETNNTSLLDKSLLLTSIVGYGFEMGPGNEWLVTKVGKEILEQVAVHGNVPLTAALVGAGVAGLSLTEHTFLGLVMNRNIHKFPKTVGVISDSKFGKSDVLRNSRDRGLVGRFGNAFSVGAATVNLEDSVTDPDFIPENKGVKRSIQSATLVAAGSLCIGTVAGGGIQYALNEGNMELGYRILGHVSNPLWWTGLFVGVRLNDYRKNRKARKFTDPSLEEEMQIQ